LIAKVNAGRLLSPRGTWANLGASLAGRRPVAPEVVLERVATHDTGMPAKVRRGRRLPVRPAWIGTVTVPFPRVLLTATAIPSATGYGGPCPQLLPSCDRDRRVRALQGHMHARPFRAPMQEAPRGPRVTT
jgi:hypothetical protein